MTDSLPLALSIAAACAASMGWYFESVKHRATRAQLAKFKPGPRDAKGHFVKRDKGAAL